MSVKEIFLENLAIKKIQEECLARYNMGRDNYGIFDPIKDQRDLHKEFEDEILDSINYLMMILIKHRTIRESRTKGL